MIPFSFATGIENSSPTIANGSIRRDQMAECGHYERWREDFELVRQLGIRALRYGVPLYRTWLGPGRYDWDFADQAFGELRRLGLTPITDLCHFGVPDWIGNFQNPDFPEQFQVNASAFAARYPWIRLYTPVNEMYVCARASSLFGWWNEQEKTERSYVTALKHLAKANVLAVQAILRLRPDAVFVQSTSTEYFHASEPGAVDLAETRNAHRFIPLDLNYGRPLEPLLRSFVLDNGMREEECRWFEENAVRGHSILGTDYYPSNEHHVQPDGSRGGAEELLGYPMVASEYYNRYRLPLMHTETNLDQGPAGDEASEWLRRQWIQLRGLIHVGIPVLGFTWYSLTDQIDWDLELREQRGTVNPRGLYDLQRRIRPVGTAYRELIASWGKWAAGAAG
jgi:beta-glucosidase/6-phospho-beta-glucosidase/beta-galactosidase